MNFFKAKNVYYDQRNGSWILGEEMMINLNEVVSFSVVVTGNQNVSNLDGKIFELSLTNEPSRSSSIPVRVTSKYLEEKFDHTW